MSSWTSKQQAAAAGLVAMVLLIIGNFITGAPPKFDDSSSEVTKFFTDHHHTILVAMILTGLAVPFYLWFIVNLAGTMPGPIGRVIGLGGILVAAIASGGDALTAALSQATKQGAAADTIRTLFQLSSLVYGRIFWGAATVAIAVALAAARGALPRWVQLVALIQAVLMLLGGLSIKGTGFLSPTGGMAFIAFVAYFLGTAAFAVALWQSVPARE